MDAAAPRLQGHRWVFTLNNWVAEDVERLRELGRRDNVRYIVFGREVGASGTPHLQGYLHLRRHQRFRSVKNLVGNRAHLSLARGTAAQASEYCKKDGDFEEFGDLNFQQGHRTDWDDFKRWAQELTYVPSQREIILAFPALWLRYSRRLLEIAEAYAAPPDIIEGEPRAGWQSDLNEQVQGKADRRTITFVIDEEGNKGKTWLARYLFSKYPEKVQLLKSGRIEDMAYSVDETKSVFIIDVQRSKMPFLQYSILEDLKDRMIFSTKYVPKMKVLRTNAHVIVMCNEQPDMTRLSIDRFSLINI